MGEVGHSGVWGTTSSGRASITEIGLFCALDFWGSLVCFARELNQLHVTRHG
jgi:hypothetical protein